MLTLDRVLGEGLSEDGLFKRKKLSQGPEALLSRGESLTFSASDRFLWKNETQGGEENCRFPGACVCQRLLSTSEKLCFELIGTPCSGKISIWNKNLWVDPWAR